MQLHNTLTQQVDTFQPLDDKLVRVYSCGPTVYDHIHIGNLSAFIMADTLRRSLLLNGYRVEHVMNFTDVDDKTIRRSRETYPDLPPIEALLKLTRYYTDLFLADMRAVGNTVEGYSFIRATDPAVIDGMRRLITKLLADGFAYIADDGVYFSIAAYRQSGKTYGQLSAVNAETTSEARIQNDEYDKEAAHDFALWKKQRPGEPAWDFSLDGHDMTGRPGWHIECSVMSFLKLGQPFDIHTGGIDLIFPHHENEIAQSTAGRTDPFYARYFVHNEHILIDGRKMSKSLGNFHTLETIRKKGFDPLAFRLLVLQGHYRSQTHFSWKNLEAAQNRLDDLKAMAVLQWQPQAVTFDSGSIWYEDVAVELSTNLANDLNTPGALAFLSEVSKQSQTVLVSKENLSQFSSMLVAIDSALGLDLANVPDISKAQKELLARRKAARDNQDWAESDRLRTILLNEGVELRDTPMAGTIWYWS